MTILLTYSVRITDLAPGRSQPTLARLDQDKESIAVAVSGLHGKEGIYFFPKGFFVGYVLNELQAKADGMRASFSSCPLEDHIEISLREGRWELRDMSPAKRLALGLPMDVNSATWEELQFVPGIGAKLAECIITTRETQGPFRELSDLTKVRGIKEKRLEGIRRYLTVRKHPLRNICQASSQQR